MELIISSLEAIGFNWHIAIVNFINFLIIFFVLKYFVWGKVFKIIQDRKEKIEQGLIDANKSKELLQNVEIEKDKIISDSKLQANVEYDRIIEKSILVTKDIEEKSKRSQELLQEELKSKINKAKDTALSELQRESPKLFRDFLVKTFSKNMTAEENNRIIQSLLK